MPIGNWNLDFSSHNSQRAYPLAQDATRLDQTGEFEIPNDFIVGLSLPVAAGPDVQPSRFYVKHIGSFASGYSITVGYDGDDDPVNVATALISRETHEENTTYALGGLGDFYDSFGSVTIGLLNTIDEQPAGFWTFDLEGSRLETDAIRPDLRGVSALIVVNGTSRSLPLTGDIELVAGENMQLVPSLVAGQDAEIRFSAIEGEGTIEDCVCDGTVTSTPVKTINGIPPTPTGDFTLLAGSCLEFETVENGLELRNTCFDPCCDCAELSPIAAKLQELRDQVATFEAFLGRLETSVQQTGDLTLGSKLRDRGCFSCS